MPRSGCALLHVHETHAPNACFNWERSRASAAVPVQLRQISVSGSPRVRRLPGVGPGSEGATLARKRTRYAGDRAHVLDAATRQGWRLSHPFQALGDGRCNAGLCVAEPGPAFTGAYWRRDRTSARRGGRFRRRFRCARARRRGLGPAGRLRSARARRCSGACTVRRHPWHPVESAVASLGFVEASAGARCRRAPQSVERTR